MAATRAIVVREDLPERLAIATVPLAPAAPTDVTVRVTAISLNRGETKRALSTEKDGTRPGWDFVGIVEEAAQQGKGPAVGQRVVGILRSGAWAERVRAPVDAVAPLPDDVTDAEAATLPVAGLTALHALRQGGMLLGRKVLVDGATGGVGQFAIQLAAASGAQVWGHVRRADQCALIAGYCTGGVVTGPGLESARETAPYDLIVDSLGGSALAAAMTMLRTGGTCVTLGVSESPTLTVESGPFFRQGRVNLYGLILFPEFARGETAGQGLALLAGLVSRKLLKPPISIEAPWTEIADVARRLIDRKFTGKAVLRVG